MELTGEIKDALNAQVTLEISAALVYRQLSIDMAALDLPGIASWFKAQADEEMLHADKFIAHMLDRGVTPQFGAIPAATGHADSVLAAFEAALAHEKKVSESIRQLYRTAQAAGDIDAYPLLNWFVEEQLEEEASVSAIIAHIRLIGDDGNGLLRLDTELGSRGTTAEA